MSSVTRLKEWLTAQAMWVMRYRESRLIYASTTIVLKSTIARSRTSKGGWVGMTVNRACQAILISFLLVHVMARR